MGSSRQPRPCGEYPPHRAFIHRRGFLADLLIKDGIRYDHNMLEQAAETIEQIGVEGEIVHELAGRLFVAVIELIENGTYKIRPEPYSVVRSRVPICGSRPSVDIARADVLPTTKLKDPLGRSRKPRSPRHSVLTPDMSMQCSACAEPVNRTAQFCEACGAPILGAAKQSAPGSERSARIRHPARTCCRVGPRSGPRAKRGRSRCAVRSALFGYRGL